MPSAQPALPMQKGFDQNEPVSAARAKSFHEKGFRFCLRYVGRRKMAAHDLTAAELDRLLNAGLAVMPVQHVEDDNEPGWFPTAEKGTEYGRNAGRFARELGFPDGVNVWLDLELVHKAVPAETVIAYCNNWFREVEAAGFKPGVYVGFHPGLSNDQLRHRLKFSHYWGSLNVDAKIPGRGWQMKQEDAHALHQEDFTRTDDLGGTVHWLQPKGWTPFDHD